MTTPMTALPRPSSPLPAYLHILQVPGDRLCVVGLVPLKLGRRHVAEDLVALDLGVIDAHLAAIAHLGNGATWSKGESLLSASNKAAKYVSRQRFVEQRGTARQDKTGSKSEDRAKMRLRRRVQ